MNIEIRHYRATDPDFNDNRPVRKGGITIAFTVTKTQILYGIAYCSKHDHYCKRTGRELAEFRIGKDGRTISLAEFKEWLKVEMSKAQFAIYNKAYFDKMLTEANFTNITTTLIEEYIGLKEQKRPSVILL